MGSTPTMGTTYTPIAQWIVQQPSKLWVVGSNPTWSAIYAQLVQSAEATDSKSVCSGFESQIGYQKRKQYDKKQRKFNGITMYNSFI